MNGGHKSRVAPHAALFSERVYRERYDTPLNASDFEFYDGV